jgi:hypothetical protein
MAVVLLLVFALAPWPLAAQERAPSHDTGFSNWVQRVWGLLMSGWQGAGLEEAVQNPTPPASTSSTDSSDAGMQVDPWG